MLLRVIMSVTRICEYLVRRSFIHCKRYKRNLRMTLLYRRYLEGLCRSLLKSSFQPFCMWSCNCEAHVVCADIYGLLRRLFGKYWAKTIIKCEQLINCNERRGVCIITCIMMLVKGQSPRLVYLNLAGIHQTGVQ